MEVVNSEYLFHSTINDVVSIINAKMTNPKVQFVAYMERDIPNQLIGDEVRLRQVLLNLLSNSVKYTREGRITLDVAWTRTGEDTLVLTIRIKDTGIGIKKEDLEKLFGEFQQFDMEKNKNVEGTGLGLAITHNLVRLMGGDVTAESTYELGSIFTLTLPQQFIPNGTATEWSDDELNATGNAVLLTGRTRIEQDMAEKTIKRFKIPSVRILVVDDVPTNLRVAQGLLAPYEAKVDICLSGREALQAVAKNDYDLIFMDHMMPEMDGLETTRAIRELDGGRFADKIIVALSANAIIGAKEMFLQNGFNDFVSKPIEVEKLHAVLLKWIANEKHVHEDTAVENTAPLALLIDGIDTAKGLRHSGGSKEVYEEILMLFHEDIEAKLEQLTHAERDKDINLYIIYVHALKSACANIGATALSELSEKLESAAIKRDSTYITAHNPALLNGLTALQHSIGKALGIEKAAEDAPETDYDHAALSESLLKLKTALESYNALAIDEASKAVNGFLKYAALKKPLKELLDDVFIGLYPEAVKRIDEML
jgi:CheY-like chemotaxis protein/HPt (histidine-containing phosphotransfer) domain-containing protein